MPITRLLTITLAVSSVISTNGLAADLKISPHRVHLRPGEKREFTTGKDTSVKCMWNSMPSAASIGMKLELKSPVVGGTSNGVTVTAPEAQGGLAYTRTVTLTCMSGADMDKALVALTSSNTGLDEGTDITTAIVGYEQAGASAAESNGNFFFDF